MRTPKTIKEPDTHELGRPPGESRPYITISVRSKPVVDAGSGRCLWRASTHPDQEMAKTGRSGSFEEEDNEFDDQKAGVQDRRKEKRELTVESTRETTLARQYQRRAPIPPAACRLDEPPPSPSTSDSQTCSSSTTPTQPSRTGQ